MPGRLRSPEPAVVSGGARRRARRCSLDRHPFIEYRTSARHLARPARSAADRPHHKRLADETAAGRRRIRRDNCSVPHVDGPAARRESAARGRSAHRGPPDPHGATSRSAGPGYLCRHPSDHLGCLTRRRSPPTRHTITCSVPHQGLSPEVARRRLSITTPIRARCATAGAGFVEPRPGGCRAWCRPCGRPGRRSPWWEGERAGGMVRGGPLDAPAGVGCGCAGTLAQAGRLIRRTATRISPCAAAPGSA